MSKKDIKDKLIQEIKGLLLLAATLFLSLSLFSFNQLQPEYNWFGILGYSLSYGLLFLFGLTVYIPVALLGVMGWQVMVGNPMRFSKRQLIFFSLMLFSTSILLNLIAENDFMPSSFLASRVYSQITLLDFPFPHKIARYNLGGVPTYYLLRDLPFFNFQHLLSNLGVAITFTIAASLSLLLFFNTRIHTVASLFKAMYEECKFFFIKVYRDIVPKKINPMPPLEEQASYTYEEMVEAVPAFDASTPSRKPSQPTNALPTTAEHMTQSAAQPPINMVAAAPTTNQAAPESQITISSHFDKKVKISKARFKVVGTSDQYRRYRLPPLSLVTDAKKLDQPSLKKDLEAQAKVLESTLLSFGVEAKVGQIYCGPTITSFEVHPPIGVKVQKIKVLENDIALNMQAKSIRIIAPIPGKAAVGVEVPSLFPQEVGFKEMLSEYQKGKERFHIPILLGQTVTGENVLCDLTKMPHCIIAGATGSGKSVCINSIVMSILMTAKPDQIKLLLVDPKKVELSAYTNLPHMIAPVITEAHGAHAALNWLVAEMTSRYEILKHLKLRNIHSFNTRKVDEKAEAAMPITIPKTMPYIVGIIDEFADLMMVANCDIETPIARIAQMARAVGIHLILATQRPSREVITGIIKANFPSRISFKVSSRVNSQIILDENGADSLLGNGDMLFMPPGSSALTRAQGVFIRDNDINRIISHIENQAGPNFLIKSFDEMALESSESEASSESSDELYSAAFQTVISTGNASTTFLQRKLKIGYARAASLIDALEANKVIGPADGARGRQVLVSSSEAN